MFDKDYILKVLFSIALIFVLFLWSGGVYDTDIVRKVRVNKITGSVEVLKKENNQVSWKKLKD